MSLANNNKETKELKPKSGMELSHLGTVNFENTYSKLPKLFYQRINPKPVSAPKLIKLNHPLALQLGLDPLTVEQLDTNFLAGNEIPKQSTPIAMVYAGHQFGNWVPRLGDGRAVLLGELIDQSGIRRDLQLKGSGPTLFSRMGDGRASLGPVIREYVVSEGMAALGIPTTRALAISTTGDMLVRETMEPGAILTRIASSHLRIGTFQYFYGQQDTKSLRLLADYAINRHYPNAGATANPYLELLDNVTKKTAEVISSWMLVGFIHGVMNTDNTSIAGETIDYGPCAFLDFFNPSKVYSSIDTMGRYAYNQQPAIGLWNLTRFAETILGIIGPDKEAAKNDAQSILEKYWGTFENHFHRGLCKKIGLPFKEENLKLAFELLDCMTEENGDFTITFRTLTKLLTSPDSGQNHLDEYLPDGDHFKNWAKRWLTKINLHTTSLDKAAHNMNKINPLFIPRNHQIQRAINFAVDVEDYQPMETLIDAISNPFEDNASLDYLTFPPQPSEEIKRTFCGT